MGRPNKALQLPRRRPGLATATSRQAAGSGVDSPPARRSWQWCTAARS